MKELLGQILGVIIVVVGAWFAALGLMAYSLGDVLPWRWSIEQRSIHLALQVALILGYFVFVRMRRAE